MSWNRKLWCDCTRNVWGVWELCDGCEAWQAFKADFPDWESREIENDLRESGMLITESDLEIGESDWHQQIADWDAFFAIQSELGE